MKIEVASRGDAESRRFVFVLMASSSAASFGSHGILGSPFSHETTVRKTCVELVGLMPAAEKVPVIWLL